MNESEKNLNRLKDEKSPYLLHHSANPVDWYPWGEEAFTAAKLQDKPIFLSIGYSTCHWCHMMEKESFENKEIATLLNATFINVKVDREELPEIDALYMDFAQSLMVGSPGWPLNMILTPDLYPFFAATYLPPTQKGSLLGVKELTLRIKEVWQSEERESVLMQAEKIFDLYSENALPPSSQNVLTFDLLRKSAELYFKVADPLYGGIKGAPKFPVGYQSTFLLNYSKIEGDSRALFLVEKTLDMMQRGGIYDQIGGGFSRYSVDERWIIPHFEKMLYDNALLVDAYLNAFKLTKINHYLSTAKEVLDYVLTEMRSQEGGFFSAEDADSEGEEGKFYVFGYEEILNVLGKEKGARFASFYGATLQGNFHGKNVLYQPITLEEFSLKEKIDPIILRDEFKGGKRALYKEREKRVRPFKDDKIITSWNALMIHSMLEVGITLNDEKYIGAATHALDFLIDKLYKNKVLYRRYREGDVQHKGNLDDYASLIRTLLTFFERGRGFNYLKLAIQLTDIVLSKFSSDSGAFYQSDGSDSSIILRKILLTDGAEPSGNAIFCEDLIRLYKITYDERYKNAAEEILKVITHALEETPIGYFYHLMNFWLLKSKESETLFVSLGKNDEFKSDLINAFCQTFSPLKSLVVIPYQRKDLEELYPHLASYPPLEGKTTLYRCKEHVCLPPITDFNEIVASFST